MFYLVLYYFYCVFYCFPLLVLLYSIEKCLMRIEWIELYLGFINLNWTFVACPIQFNSNLFKYWLQSRFSSSALQKPRVRELFFLLFPFNSWKKQVILISSGFAIQSHLETSAQRFNWNPLNWAGSFTLGKGKGKGLLYDTLYVYSLLWSWWRWFLLNGAFFPCHCCLSGPGFL